VGNRIPLYSSCFPCCIFSWLLWMGSRLIGWNLVGVRSSFFISSIFWQKRFIILALPILRNIIWIGANAWWLSRLTFRWIFRETLKLSGVSILLEWRQFSFIIPPCFIRPTRYLAGLNWLYRWLHILISFWFLFWLPFKLIKYRSTNFCQSFSKITSHGQGQSI